MNVLLIEDNPGDAELVQEALCKGKDGPFALEWVDSLSAGLAHMAEKDIDALILDLALPDSMGLDTLRTVRAQRPDVPIVVLTGLYDNSLGVQAVSEGAQDYLVKGQIDGDLLDRAIRYATVRKRAEEERARFIREQAKHTDDEKLGRAKDEFLAVLSHELRTPLTAILGWSQLMNAGWLDENNSALAIESIERNARSQAQLIDTLLDFSGLIAGKARLDFRPVELTAIVEAAISFARPLAEANGIQLRTSFARQAIFISGDADRLKQTVCHLLSNAIKFTPDGGRIEVSQDLEGDYARIKVSDTGIGINPEFMPHIFHRFWQADSSSTRAYGGLGLGLALVRHLVELHGGSVKAESPGEGLGATFTVSIPIIKSDDAISDE
jgi:signal transduction histidine kinase